MLVFEEEVTDCGEMGGSKIIDDDLEIKSPSSEVRNVVLVGRSGNGKSATGNSLLGRKQFKSMRSSDGVTSTCEVQATVLDDGLTLNVIDTPGLFDPNIDHEFIAKEIGRCINMAKDGIHAVLVVLMASGRFTSEEVKALHVLENIFGSRLIDYTVVVFTRGDDFEDDEESSFDDFLRNASDPLKVELKLKEAISRLEEQLAKEREAQAKSKAEMRRLRENVERAQRKAEEARRATG